MYVCEYGVGAVVMASGAGGEGSGGGVAEHTPAAHMREGVGGQAGVELAKGGHDRFHDRRHDFLSGFC